MAFLHVVYFWVREGGTQEDAEKIAEGCRTYLTQVPGVTRFAVGHPAGTPRAVVDNTYGTVLVTEFADVAGHDVYQDHPLHLQFIAECKAHWSRVQVYDSII